MDYDNDDPWPNGAAGQGQSLNRKPATSFGNFADSWEAASPSPGAVAGVPNAAPVANPDAYSVDEGATLEIVASGVLANDQDSDGDPLSAQLISGPVHGILMLTADGSFSYTHDGSETTTDSFQYRVSDGNGGIDTTTVSLAISPVNDAPVASGDSYSVNEGAALTVDIPGVLANDTDSENNTLEVRIIQQPQFGALILNANGSFEYEHDGSEHASDSFIYEVADGSGGVDTAQVGISINPVNDPPVASNDVYSVGEGQVLNVAAAGLLLNDSDADGDALTATLSVGPIHGTVTVNDNGSFSYEHDGSETTNDSFSYSLNDGNGGVATGVVTINVTPVNDPPVATNDAYAVDEGELLEVVAPGVRANDVDADGDALTVSLVEGPQHGTLTLNPNGSFAYAHDGGESTTDSFRYSLSDGTAASTANVSINIGGTNDAPIAIDDAYSVAEGATLNIPAAGVLTNDSDADGDSLSVSLSVAPRNGTVTLNSDGSFAYTHDGSETSSDSFRYAASDGLLTSSATVSISIDSTNDAPAPMDDTYSVDEGATLTVVAAGVLENDSDPDGDTLTATLRTQAANGTVTLAADGSFEYVHDGSESTSDSFTYVVSDGQGANEFATVNVTINPVNDSPIANDDTYAVDQGGILSVVAPGLLSNDSDIENDPLSTAVVSEPSSGSLTLNADGSFVYDHDGADTNSVTFVYRVLDGNSASDEATVVIDITAAGIPGDFNNDNAVTVEDIDHLCGAIRGGATDLRYDIDGGGSVDLADFDALIFGVIGTTVGDSNVDGVFDSSDLILVFQRNEYEDSIVDNSTWADGDWGCDGEFDSGDLVIAFQAGDYQKSAVANVHGAVAASRSPEPDDEHDSRPTVAAAKVDDESARARSLEPMEARDTLFADQADWSVFEVVDEEAFIV